MLLGRNFLFETCRLDAVSEFHCFTSVSAIHVCAQVEYFAGSQRRRSVFNSVAGRLTWPIVQASIVDIIVNAMSTLVTKCCIEDIVQNILNIDFSNCVQCNLALLKSIFQFSVTRLPLYCQFSQLQVR